MPDKNELEIIISLQDKATKEFKTVADKLKKGTSDVESETKKLGSTSDKTNKSMIQGFRDQVKPMSTVISTVTRLGLIWGVTFGAMVKAVIDLGKEIDDLDRLSIKLGVSSSELSKKFYGFDITTQQARTGVASMNNFLSSLGDKLLFVKMKTAEAIAENDIFNKQYQGLANATARLQMLAGVPMEMVIAPKSMSREDAIAEINAEQMARRLASKEGQALSMQEEQMYKQMTLSKVEYTRYQFEQQTELMRSYGTNTDRLEKAFAEKERNNNLMTLNQLKADRLEIEGDTIGALRLQQEIELDNFKQMKNDELLIETLSTNQRIKLSQKIRQQKQREFEMIASGLGQLSGAMQAYAAQNSKQAKAAAAVALASTIVNTAAAVMSGLATPPMIPVGLAMAAFAAATGAVQIATISGQSFEKGGRPPVGEASIVGERGKELFIPDTAGTIIPNNKLGNLGSQTYIHIEINNPTVKDDEDLSKMAEEVSAILSREVERI